LFRRRPEVGWPRRACAESRALRGSLLGLFRALGVGVQIAEVVERLGDVRQVGVDQRSVGRGELAPNGERLDVSLLGLFHALGVAVQSRQVVERRGATSGIGGSIEHCLIRCYGLFEVVELLREVSVFEGSIGGLPEFPGLAVGVEGLGPFEAEFVNGSKLIEVAGERGCVFAVLLHLTGFEAESGVEIAGVQESGQFGFRRFRRACRQLRLPCAQLICLPDSLGFKFLDFELSGDSPFDYLFVPQAQGDGRSETFVPVGKPVLVIVLPRIRPGQLAPQNLNDLFRIAMERLDFSV
jgi:hypothetical protein